MSYGVGYNMKSFDTMNGVESILKRVARHDDVDAVAIADNSGILLTSHAGSKMKMELLAMMSATVQMAAYYSTKELGHDQTKRIIIESNGGKLIVNRAGENSLMIAVLRDSEDLGNVMYELDKAADEVGEYIA